MVLDMAEPKNKENTTWLGMRGRDAVRKSTPKVNILQVFTIDFSEIQFIVNHNSQSDGQNKSAKSGMNLQKKDHTYKLIPEEKRRYKGQRYLTLNKEGKHGPMKLRSDFGAAVLMKNRLHHESGEQIEERLHPDQPRRWHSYSSTSWWDKSDWNWKWADKNCLIDLLFVTVGFVYSRWRPTATDGGVDGNTSHVIFLMHLAHVHTSHCGSRCRSVCLTKITHAHVITCLSVWCFLALSSFLLSLSRLCFLSHCLLVLCPAHQLSCGRNRGE